MTENPKQKPRNVPEDKAEAPVQSNLNLKDLEKAQGGYTPTKERPAPGGGQAPANP